MTSHNQEIGRQLKAAHGKWARGVGRDPRAIRLPAETHLLFKRDGRGVSLTMSSDAVCSNMQTNAGGFEGWCLAIKLWLPEFETITISWSAPFFSETAEGRRSRRHYARFLFRVQRFHELFPEWFAIGTPGHLGDCIIRKGGDFFLNVAGSRKADRVKPHREAEIEAALVGKFKTSMLSTFKLEAVDRQFPVGLFRTAIKQQNAIFTGGTSAIDTGTLKENRSKAMAQIVASKRHAFALRQA